MKPIVVVALNLVTVAVALLAYDVMRGPAAAPQEPAATAETQGRARSTDTDALEDRLRALESDRRHVRRPGSTDPDVLARLDALETAFPGIETTAGSGRVGESAVASTPFASPDASTASDSEPTATEIKRFRRLQAAVRREEAIEKNKLRIDATLDALPVNLSAAEREGVHRAYADFQPRVGEIWGEVKTNAQATIAAGGQVDRATIVADTTAVIQQEFAETLSAVVGAADSETIAGALLARGK